MLVKKIAVILIILSIIIIFSGCWDINEIDRTQFPMCITIDKINNKYLFCFQMPTLRAEAPRDVNNVKTIDYSIESARENIQSRTIGWLSLSLLRIIIFNEDVAREGLLTHLDSLWRNPLISGSILFGISEERAAKIIDVKNAAINNMGNYLMSLFETSSRNSLIPEVTLNNFYIALRNRMIDPYIPILKYGSTDIQVAGTAVFKGDKMVGKLEIPETRALLLLTDSNSKGEVSLKIDDYIVVYFIQGASCDITPSFRNNNLQFNVKLNVEADIVENTSGIRLVNNEKGLKRMEKYLAESLKKEVVSLFEQLQKNKSDVIGISRIAKTKKPDLDKRNWREEYAAADIQVEVKVNINRIGTST